MKVHWPMTRSSARPLHRLRQSSAVRPCRNIQKRLDVTREENSRPSSSVPSASPRPIRIVTDRSKVVNEHTCTAMLVLTSTEHTRRSTVVNQLCGRINRSYNASRPSLRYISPTCPNGSMRFQLLSLEHLSRH